MAESNGNGKWKERWLEAVIAVLVMACGAMITWSYNDVQKDIGALGGQIEKIEDQVDTLHNKATISHMIDSLTSADVREIKEDISDIKEILEDVTD